MVSTLNLFERWFPQWGLKRQRARNVLSHSKRLYDAAKYGPFYGAPIGGSLSGDAVMAATADKLRSNARLLDENHDLAVGVLNTLVDNIVGDGIQIEPMIRTGTRQPELAPRVNAEVRRLWADWWRNAEVTREYPGNTVERLACLSWLRDGEVLMRHWQGNGGPPAVSAIPYSVQLLEADYLPFTDFDTGNVQGVEKDAFGRPVAYHLYKVHPGNSGRGLFAPNMDTERVDADRITHLKNTRRIRQTRGVPILHAVINRLEGIKDAEQSELIAARVAADFCATITRDADFAFDTGHLEADGSRQFAMESGQIFDKLLPGEKVETIDSKRPNNALMDFRDSQLRAVAAGTSTSYSSISKNYSGTYSSQRQELVETQPGYLRLSQVFIDVLMRDIYRRFIDMAMISGQLVIPAGINRSTLYDAEMVRGGGVPWIDPLKEVQADIAAIDAGLQSRPGVIRKRGGDPAAVTAELEGDDFETADQAAMSQEPAQPPTDEQNQEDAA
jgi:lambda family phage portal protein